MGELARELVSLDVSRLRQEWLDDIDRQIAVLRGYDTPVQGKTLRLVEPEEARETRKPIIPPQSVPDMPDNERRFFKGMALGKLDIDKVIVAGNPSKPTFGVRVGTRNHQLRSRVMEITLGRYGDFHQNSTSKPVRAYVAEDPFGLMLEPEVTEEDLHDKDSLSPLVLGLLSVHLDSGQIPLDDEVLEKLNGGFNENFGFLLGRRNERSDRPNPFLVIRPKRRTEVFAALSEVEAVRTLPFYRELAQVTR